METEGIDKYYYKATLLSRSIEHKKLELKEINSKIAAHKSRYGKEKENFENVKNSLRNILGRGDTECQTQQLGFAQNKIKSLKKGLNEIKSELDLTLSAKRNIASDLSRQLKNVETLDGMAAKQKALLLTNKEMRQSEALLDLLNIKKENSKLSIGESDRSEMSRDFESDQISDFNEATLLTSAQAEIDFTGGLSGEALPSGSDSSSQHSHETPSHHQSNDNNSRQNSYAQQGENSSNRDLRQGIQDLKNWKSGGEETLSFEYNNQAGRTFALEFRMDLKGELALIISAVSKKDLFALKFAELEIKKMLQNSGIKLRKIEIR